MNRVGDTLLHVGANEGLIKALIAKEVEFIVIGGLAVSWFCPDRQADDMDLFVNPTMENSARIYRTLNDLHMHGFAPDTFAKSGLQIPLKQFYYAELLTPQKDGPTFSEVAENAVEAKLFNIPIQVASIKWQILMKEKAVASAELQRNKHLKDIERLKLINQ